MGHIVQCAGSGYEVVSGVMDSPPPTCIGTLYNDNPQEYLPSEEDIHFWTYREDEETVSRMLDLLEDAEELEDAKEAKRPFQLHRGLIELDD